MLGVKLDDILKVLDRWGEWKRMRETPPKVVDLEARVAELEQKLNGPWPPDVCRMCGERAARLDQERNHDKGLIQQVWLCKSCGEQDFRYFKPPTKGA